MKHEQIFCVFFLFQFVPRIPVTIDILTIGRMENLSICQHFKLFLDNYAYQIVINRGRSSQSATWSVRVTKMDRFNTNSTNETYRCICIALERSFHACSLLNSSLFRIPHRFGIHCVFNVTEWNEMHVKWEDKGKKRFRFFHETPKHSSTTCSVGFNTSNSLEHLISFLKFDWQSTCC